MGFSRKFLPSLPHLIILVDTILSPSSGIELSLESCFLGELGCLRLSITATVYAMSDMVIISNIVLPLFLVSHALTASPDELGGSGLAAHARTGKVDPTGSKITQSRYQVGLHRSHIFYEITLEDGGDGRQRAKSLLVTRGVLRLQDLEEVGHDCVAVGQELCLGNLDG